MSYDNPVRETYSIFANAFGATTTSKKYQGPPGKKGLVRDIRVFLSAAAVGTTSVPEVDVGSAAGDSSFARFLLGTTAIAGYAAGEYRARPLCQNAQGRTGENPPQLSDFAHHIFLEGNDASGTASIPGTVTTQTFIPADTLFVITGTAGVGGTPAGTGDIDVIIDWF